MEEKKLFEIRTTDGLYNISRNIWINEEEEKEIIKILKEAGLKPSKIEAKGWITAFIIGGFTFYLASRYALNHLFDEIDKKIKELLLKNKKRRYLYEKEIKNQD